MKEDGLLIYSTCTYNADEDEKNVAWIIEELGAELLSVPIKEEWGITVSDFGYHFYPHKTKGEGFFLAVLKKSISNDSPCNIKKSKKKLLIDKQIANTFQKFLSEPVEFTLYGTTYYALLKERYELVSFLSSQLRTLYAGIPMGCCKGKDLIPDAALAFSWLLNTSNFTAVEVGWEEAIAFLRRENLFLPNEPKGILLLTYENVPLGWVKNLGNRCNNLYPQEWRIRMEGNNAEYTKILK